MGRTDASTVRRPPDSNSYTGRGRIEVRRSEPAPRSPFLFSLYRSVTSRVDSLSAATGQGGLLGACGAIRARRRARNAYVASPASGPLETVPSQGTISCCSERRARHWLEGPGVVLSATLTRSGGPAGFPASGKGPPRQTVHSGHDVSHVLIIVWHGYHGNPPVRPSSLEVYQLMLMRGA